MAEVTPLPPATCTICGEPLTDPTQHRLPPATCWTCGIPMIDLQEHELGGPWVCPRCRPDRIPTETPVVAS
jgi:predicted Zn-ribbon and HTH transcriptional regulator